MTVVEVVDAIEVVQVLPKAEARRLTDAIRAELEQLRRAGEGVWRMLMVAYDRGAWRTLGYGSWREYAMKEFGLSQTRAYELLDKARVVTAIEDVAGCPGPMAFELSARDVNLIKRSLRRVTNAVERRHTQKGNDPAELRLAVSCVVDELRHEAAKKATDRARRIRRQRRAADEALERARVHREVTKIGGDPSRAYSLVRRLARMLDSMISASDDPDQRAILRDALAHANAAEDGLVAALRLGRVDQ